jgi:hypothetical protein
VIQRHLKTLCRMIRIVSFASPFARVSTGLAATKTLVPYCAIPVPIAETGRM